MLFEMCSSHLLRVLTLEDVEADTAKLVDVRMVDFGQEANLRRSHGVVIWQEEFEFKDSA